MRYALAALLGALPVCGCSGVPEVLVVEGHAPGTYWEIVSFEGPCHVEGKVQTGPGEGPRDLRATVFVVAMERRGWGTLLPWCWFGHDRASQYMVEYSTESSRGETVVSWWSPPPGVLTDARLTCLLLIAAIGDDAWSMPICDGRQAWAAREHLLQRHLGGGPHRPTIAFARSDIVPSVQPR